jgi:hypothetical protein
MRMKKAGLLLLLMVMTAFSGFAQITTSTISGIVKDQSGQILPGATVHMVHEPTGTQYNTVTNQSGAFTIPAVRPGGPYTLHARFIGYRQAELKDINTQLGITTNVDFVMIEEASNLSEVVVTAQRNGTFSKERTGAAQNSWRDQGTKRAKWPNLCAS